jgi:dihydropyrimidine dehydrogenase (NAD+) subunit PreT
VGRNVVVIGGGMTAIDAAVQAKLLGAEDVTIVYRRGRSDARLALRAGPARVQGRAHHLQCGAPGARDRQRRGCGETSTFEYTADELAWASCKRTGETFTLPADQVFKAIGQTLGAGPRGADARGRQDRRHGAGRPYRFNQGSGPAATARRAATT